MPSTDNFQPRAVANSLPTAFDIVQWMDEAAVRDFFRLVQRRSFAPGQAVYTQDEPGAEMYRIASGLVRLLARQPDGREAGFLLFVTGDCFGVSSLVDHEPRPQTAECLTAVELDVLDVKGFVELLARHESFTKAVMRLLARQMRVVSRYYARASLTSLVGRIATRIIELATTKTDSSGTVILSVELPQSELASLTGTSRQSVNKTLQTLQHDGVLQLSRRAILVRDIHALRRLAEQT